MRLAFAVPQTGPVSLRLFNVHGAVVATLFDAVAQGQRTYQFPFQTGALASGVYFQRLEASGMQITKKIVVLR